MELSTTKTNLRCRHCDQPVPKHLKKNGFCCHGCETVYQVLHDLKLESYYDIRKQTGETGQPVQATATVYAYLDHAIIHEQAVTSHGGFTQITFALSGVHCTACVWVIEKLPDFLPGVLRSRLMFNTGRVEIDFDLNQVCLSEIAQQLHQLGYPPRLVSKIDAAIEIQTEDRENRDQWLRIGVAGFCAANSMMVAVSIWEGMFSGIAASTQTFFGWVSAILVLPAVTYSAMPFYRRAWQGLRAKVVHMDLPIAGAIIGTFVISTINAARGKNDLYFDSLAALIFLLSIGRYLQWRAMLHVRRQLKKGAMFLPDSVEKILGSDSAPTTEQVPREAICIYDHVRIAAGERVPFDGVITTGSTSMDRSLLTGESKAFAVGPGDRVMAGCLNLTGPITLQVLAIGRDTRMGQLEALIEMQQATQHRTPYLMWIDRLSRGFVLGILGLSALTLGIVTWLSGFDVALDRVLALWIVSCPCALGLATPLTLSMAVGTAARKGILLRSVDVLEKCLRLRTVFFDETGTLTCGRLQVEKAHWVNPLSEHGKLLSKIYAIELRVHHPIARAICQWIEASPSASDVTRSSEVHLIEAVPGKGVSSDGVCVGSKHWLDSLGVLGQWPKETMNLENPNTVIGVSLDGRLQLVLEFTDPLRPEAQDTIRRLKALGLKIGILSGDQTRVVHRLAQLLELDRHRSICKGDLLPEMKLDLITQQTGPVMMVGDGINDAAAIARADVGVGITSEGTNLLHIAAPVCLGRADLRLAVDLIDLSKATRSVLTRNLVISLTYNTIGSLGAILGWINPFVAGILMPISSATVIAVSLTARAWKPIR